MKDYYAILGVSKTASMVDIKRAYRRLAILYHPDKNPDPSAEQFFKEVNEAYDVLGDESKKNWYDYKWQVDHLNVNPPPAPAPPRHRDPAYRRKSPSVTQPKQGYSLRQMMLAYMPYFWWTSWAGMGLVAILTLDYYLPVCNATEEIVDVERLRRYEILVTSHHRILLESGVPLSFRPGMAVKIQYTPFLRTVFKISDCTMTDVVELKGIYGPAIILPLALLFTSAYGILLRKNKIEFFNLSVINGILLLATIYMIFSL